MLNNETTPRVFIAATRQNEGKTTTSLGLLSALRQHFPRIGYMKPVGQRFVSVAQHKIDEDTVLMDAVYKLNCPLEDMSPIAVGPDFTRRYLESGDNNTLIKRLQEAFDRVAWEKDFVLCEGSGHAGVGSVFDLSNATIAKLLGAKAIIVSSGGIGKPIDEIALNQALFEKEGVPILGVIINKVRRDKLESIARFAERGLKRRGLALLGVIPHEPVLGKPSLELVRRELQAELLNTSADTDALAEDVVVGAMSAQNTIRYLRKGTLLITPADREDILISAAATVAALGQDALAGIVLTGDFQPSENVLLSLKQLPIPVLLARTETYRVASRVHDLTVKTRPRDAQKISLIRDVVARSVDVKKILASL